MSRIPGAQGQNNRPSCKMDVRRSETGVKRDPETIEAISRALPKGIWERKWVLLQPERTWEGTAMRVSSRTGTCGRGRDRTRGNSKGWWREKDWGEILQAQHLDWKSPTQQTIFSRLSAEEKRSCGEFLVDKQDHIKGIPDATIKATRETSRWLLP